MRYGEQSGDLPVRSAGGRSRADALLKSAADAALDETLAGSDLMDSVELPPGLELPAGASTGPALGPATRVIAVFLCGVFAFLELYATQPLLPLLESIFHASKAVVGLTVSASTLGVALSAPLVGLFAERLNRKRVIVCSIFALSVPTLLAASSPNLPVFIAWRFVQGALLPGIFAMTITYITEEWPANSVALAMSIYISGTALGGFMGRVSAGFITDWLGWRAVFIVLGLATIGGGLAVLRWLPQESHGKPAAPLADAGVLQRFKPFLVHLRNGQLVSTFFIGFNVLFTLVSSFTYVTFHLAAAPFGLSTAALGSIFTVYLVGLVATPAGGALLPRIGLRYGLAAANLLSLCGLLITLVPSLACVGVGLACICSGVFLSQACATSHIREATPTGNRASAVGLYIAFYYIGGTAGGVLPSYIWNLGGWTACVLLIAALVVVTIAIALLTWPNDFVRRARLQPL